MTMKTSDLHALGFRVVDGKAVRIEDAGPAAAEPERRRGRMNKTETAFAGLLEQQQTDGLITWWRFEPVKLRLATGAWYTPDFLAITRGGSILFYEVKGFWREAARVRIKVAAELNPWALFVVVQRPSGAWKFETIGGAR